MIVGLIGGLVPTFLISRLAIWSLKLWIPGAACLIVANVVSAAVCGAIAYGASRMSPLIYAEAQVIWLFLDLIRFFNRREQHPKAPSP